MCDTSGLGLQDTTGSLHSCHHLPTRFNLGAAQQAAPAHTHTHLHTHMHNNTHRLTSAHKCSGTDTRSTLEIVGVRCLVQPLSSEGWTLFFLYSCLSVFFFDFSLFHSLSMCVSLSFSPVSVLLTEENL